MKLLFLYNNFYQRAGLERILSNRINILAEEYGCDVYFAVLNQAQKEHAFLLSPKIHFIDLEFNGYKAYNHNFILRQLYKLRYLISETRLMQALVDSIQPDIITGFTSFPVEILLRIKTTAHVVVESHDDRDSKIWQLASIPGNFLRLRHYLIRQLYRRMQKKVDIITSLTKQDEMKWKQHGDNVVRIPNFTLFYDEHIPKHKYTLNKRVIAAGRICPQKGFDLLIDAWRMVIEKHPDWELLIYASDGPVWELQDLVSKGNVGHSVRIMPRSNNMHDVYLNADIYALSSRHEGFPLVLMEALSDGVPCVAFDCPCGPREIIVDEHNGLLVPNGNVEQFGQALCRLIENPELLRKCSLHARQSVKQFTAKEVMPQWIELYNSLLTN